MQLLPAGSSVKFFLQGGSMQILLRMCLLGLTALLVSCANLEEVRQFAGESAKLTAYREMTQNWANTYEREKPYLFDNNLALAKSEDKARREAVTDLLKIHETVAMYFAVLGNLAGDDAFSVHSNADGLAKQIKASRLTGLEDKHVDAYVRISGIVSSWMLSGYQQREIAKYVESGNDPVQTMLAGMRQVVKVYAGTLRNERGRYGFLNLVGKETPQDQIVAALANSEYIRLSVQADAARKKLTTLDQSIVKISEGHQKLYDSRNELGSDALRIIIASMSKDLKSLWNELNIVKG